MPDLAVIKATFSDWRTVKGRKQLQLILEVPLEQQGEVLARLGAPDPSNPQWVAIALLDPAVASEKPADPQKSQAAKDRYRALPEWSKAAQRAAILCGEYDFQHWMRERAGADSFPVNLASDMRREWVAGWLRDEIGVKSRGQIATDERAYKAFAALETEFRLENGQMAEAR